MGWIARLLLWGAARAGDAWAGLRRLGKISWTERRLLLEGLGLIVLLRLVLGIMPFPRARRLIRFLSVYLPKAPSERVGAADIAWAVTVAGTIVPHTACLPRAVAAHALLLRYGRESTLHLGIARDESGRVGAHVWVESEGSPVVGGDERDKYVALPGWRL